MEETPAPSGRGGCLGSALATACIVAVILYGALLVISRTEGFRVFVRKKLAEAVPMTFEIGRCALTPSLALRLERVRAVDTATPGAPEAAARRVLLRGRVDGWRRVRLVRAEVEDGHIDFVQAGEGSWAPGLLAEPAAWLVRMCGLGGGLFDGDRAAPPRGAAGPAASGGGGAPAGGTALSLALVLRDVNAAWWAAGDGGTPLARLDGVSLDVTPLRVPGRDVVHVRLAAERFDVREGAALSGLDVEFLRAGDRQLLLEMRVGRAGEAALPVDYAVEPVVFLERDAGASRPPPPVRPVTAPDRPEAPPAASNTASAGDARALLQEFLRELGGSRTANP